MTGEDVDYLDDMSFEHMLYTDELESDMLAVVKEPIRIWGLKILNIIQIGDRLFINQYGEIYTEDSIIELRKYVDGTDEAYIYGNKLYYREDALFIDKDSYLTKSGNVITQHSHQGGIIGAMNNANKAISIDNKIIEVGVDGVLNMDGLNESDEIYYEHPYAVDGILINKYKRHNEYEIRRLRVIDDYLKYETIYKK